MNEEVNKTVDNLEEISACVIEYLDTILKNMGLKTTITTKFNNNQIMINMNSNNNSILIGAYGRTLKALQLLTCKHTYEALKVYPNIILNVNNYQEQREENLVNLAKKIATEVKKTKRSVELDNMNSYERRIIHNALKEEANLSTISVGEEPNRHIVVNYVED
mgnify:CR=1 FL=1